MQGGQAPPPQSTSVSVPSFFWSVQVGAAQAPAAHPLWRQSAFALQPPPREQVAQATPRRSTRVWSRPLWLSRRGARQVAREHAWLLQSAGAAQPGPSPRGRGQGPPQSTSVSPPFLIPSLHVAGAQTWAAV